MNRNDYITRYFAEALQKDDLSDYFKVFYNYDLLTGYTVLAKKYEGRSFPYGPELARAVRKSMGFVFLVRTK